MRFSFFYFLKTVPLSLSLSFLRRFFPRLACRKKLFSPCNTSDSIEMRASLEIERERARVVFFFEKRTFFFFFFNFFSFFTFLNLPLRTAFLPLTRRSQKSVHSIATGAFGAKSEQSQTLRRPVAFGMKSEQSQTLRRLRNVQQSLDARKVERPAEDQRADDNRGRRDQNEGKRRRFNWKRRQVHS